MARLLFRDSQGREGTVELNPTETVYVGRGLECAIRTDDGMVSRRHSQVRMEAGVWVIEDLGSANGVFHNNNRVQKVGLGHGDIVQCGSLMIRYIDEQAAQNTPSPVAQPSQPQPKKGGTMVMAKHDTGGGTPSPGPGFTPAPVSQPAFGGGYGAPPQSFNANGPASASQPQPQPGLPYGGPPSMPGGGAARSGFGGSAGGAAPYGGPPGMPSAAPYGGPPAMPAANSPVPSTTLPYGGPPAMPGGGMPGGPSPVIPGSNGPPAPGLPYGGPPAMPKGGDPSMFGRGGPGSVPAANAPAGPPRDAAENKVMVDLGLEVDPSKLEADLKSLRADVEKANASFEREVADGKRVRAEAATLRERIEELRADKERNLKIVAQLKAERDEAATTASRLSAQVNALED
nr:FHA domain-containing protein [Deltaproteobacteria bacterium]